MSERLVIQAVELTYENRVTELNVGGVQYVTPTQSMLHGPGLKVNRELHERINNALAAAALNAAERSDGPTHVNWDNSEPPQLWRWSGSLAEADETCEPLERLEHHSSVCKRDDAERSDAERKRETTVVTKAFAEAALRAFEYCRQNRGDAILPEELQGVPLESHITEGKSIVAEFAALQAEGNDV